MSYDFLADIYYSSIERAQLPDKGPILKNSTKEANEEAVQLQRFNWVNINYKRAAEESWSHSLGRAFREKDAFRESSLSRERIMFANNLLFIIFGYCISINSDQFDDDARWKRANWEDWPHCAGACPLSSWISIAVWQSFLILFSIMCVPPKIVFSFV